MHDHDHDPDETLRALLTGMRRVAVVGASANPRRPSHGVLRFLLGRGLEVVAVNPGLASDAIPGVVTYGRLADIPGPVDTVDVFRAGDAIEGVVDEVLAMSPLPRLLWMQLGIRVPAAAARAEAHGIQVVMDRCPAIEMPRLGLV